MSHGPFTAYEVTRIVFPMIDGQRQIADDLDYEYEQSNGDLDLLQEREYERGRLAGQQELAALIGRAFVDGIDSL